MNHQDIERLEQQLLELHYGLLDESEAQSLRAKIETDAETASLWANTLAMAGQFADAASLAGAAHGDVKLEVPTNRISSFSSMPPAVEKEMPQEKAIPAPPKQKMNGTIFYPVEPGSKPVTKEQAVQKFNRRKRNHGRLMKIVAGLAACLLAILFGRFLFTMPQSPANAICISAQSVLEPGSSQNTFEIFTGRLASGGVEAVEMAQGISASLNISVNVDSVALLNQTVETDSSGKCTFVVPPNLQLPKNAELCITPEIFGDPVILPLEPTRCLTYLNVDKPVYRPGETIRFRSLTLERFSLTSDIDLPVRFEMLDPSGAAVKGAKLEGVTDRGVGNGEFSIPTTAPGGQYTLVVKSLDGFFPEERRTIEVRNYRAPRYKKELEFRKRSYGPGDLVEADFEAIRAEGGPLKSRLVKYSFSVDGVTSNQNTALVDAEGRALIAFNLPNHISTGKGQLSVIVDDGGTQEVISRTIPIQLGKVVVDFYPEGGYLVDGMLNRVYFSARNTLGKPIHVAGEIIDRSGKQVAKIETVRDGMGRFEFTPIAGKRYSLKVSDPIDVTNSPNLPAVVQSLPVLSTGNGVFASDENVSCEIRTVEARKVIVQMTCRGKLVANQNLDLKPGTSSLEIKVPESVEGVLRLTVLDGEANRPTPLVERLVYRELRNKLTVKVDEDSSHERTPGEPVRLTLSVYDENGEPTPAVLGVAVVDDSALSLDPKDRPQMQTHFMLTSEIEKPEDLEHANFYLSGSEESRESLDLLLGTQGWRRFVTGPNLAGSGAEGFNEQIARLIELDGTGTEPAVGGNVSSLNQQWQQYESKVSGHWRMFWSAFRWMVLPLLILLLLIYLWRPKFRFAAVGLILCMLLSSAFIVGCGGTQYAENAAKHTADQMDMTAANEGVFAEPPMEMPTDDVAPLIPELEEAEIAVRPRIVLPKRNSDGDMKPVDAIQIVRHVDSEFTPTDRDRVSSEPGPSVGGRGQLTIEQLQKLLASRGVDPHSLAAQLLDELRFPVREYAHKHVSTEADVREDFTETVYWQPLLITDSTGKATIRFDLSDSVTSFKIMADAHSDIGQIGSGGGEVVSRLPLQIEPKMPLAVTDGDRIDLPVAVINATDKELPVDVSISTSDSLKLIGPSRLDWRLDSQERTRGNFGLEVVAANNEGKASIELNGTSGNGLADRIRRELIVSPSGYPVRNSVSGILEGSREINLPIAKDIVPGSLAVSVKAYPSPLADLVGGVEGILREPHGCFEQTSATNYPNTMALLYMKQNRLANPKATRRAKSLLDRGYSKLVSFECQKLGYEWFGSDPGHEALSAFGLMQFTDMGQVMSINVAMMDRTRKWLMGRRDGSGGFHRNPRSLHSWSVEQKVVNAYILWALTEADVASGNPQRSAIELNQELNQLNQDARNSADPYLISLAASSMMNVKRNADAEFLMDKLVQLQKQNGKLEGIQTVTHSGGISKTVETTSLAVLAWVKNPKYSQSVGRATKWLVSNRQGSGGFGSTQATVLALKALVAYSKTASQASSGGVLYVKRNGKVIGQATLPKEVSSGSMVEVTGLGSEFDPGEAAKLELVVEGSDRLPYSIEVLYHSSQPPSDDRCPLALTTNLETADGKDGQAESGSTLKVKAVLKNKTAQGQPMTIATIGLPGGVEPVVEQLNEMKEAGVFDYYELRPREVICYWRTIAPSETKEINFDVTAEISGKYTGPASRAYLYYTAEQKFWTEPMSIEISK